MPQNVNTTRGPNLSLSAPTTIPNTPYINMDREKAPEVTALFQPNSSNNGLKKTPKELYVAHDTTKIKKAAITTT